MKKKKIFLYVANIGIIAVVMLFFASFILEKMYYDPGERGVYLNQITQDMSVYSELMLPGVVIEKIGIESETGFGSYSLIAEHASIGSEQNCMTRGRIVRGSMSWENDCYNRPDGNCFAWFQMPAYVTSLREFEKSGGSVFNYALDDRERANADLNYLNAESSYLAYITLDRKMSYEDFITFVREQSVEGWCAVQTNDSQYGMNTDNIGFYFQREEGYLEQEEAKTIFLDLCRNLAEQKAFCDMVGISKEKMEQTVEFVEENGLVVYGFVTVLSKEDVLHLNEMLEIYLIKVKEVGRLLKRL